MENQMAENMEKAIPKCGDPAPELWDAYLADGTVLPCSCSVTGGSRITRDTGRAAPAVPW